MANLTKADLSKPVALNEAVVDVFGGQATVRQMSAAISAEHAAFMAEKTDGGKAPHAYPHIAISYIAKCMIDPSTGKLFFDSTEEAIEILGKHPQAEVAKLFEQCLKLNKDTDLTEENIDEAAKNSGAVASSENS